MKSPAVLSAKLPVLAQQGFYVQRSRLAAYESEWHRHDCAMLLWPQTGALETCWNSGTDVEEDSRVLRARLTRGNAVLLPMGTEHCTRTATRQQRHGELYLAPEVLGNGVRLGAMRLDPAAIAMLDALLAPTLHTRSAATLVDALVEQVRSAQFVHVPVASAPISCQAVAEFRRALLREERLPSVPELACSLGVSARTLQRCFEAELGATPVTVRRRLLAAHARTLLREGCTLAQVSRRLDFSNSGHLSRLLKSVPESTS
ncbi:AraC family transcriptional regulator [Variovorax sp. RA8]|uniref:AraC family transcriptional regulator n=1 Tax=Variovorax sp. (strain JCM 16519 / RA8) TaxID=662548 RepID=UPI001315EFF2|nr:helix-turn-helix domain-containing protein [Variovorax sp. RA8]VTU38533.1 Adenosine deaminase [Variovorax sp. RA8]